jgi:hypothetical protein
MHANEHNQRAWWLLPVITATLEAGTGRSKVKASPGPISTNKKLGMVVHTCHLS